MVAALMVLVVGVGSGMFIVTMIDVSDSNLINWWAKI
jgi:hypothetical protein